MTAGADLCQDRRHPFPRRSALVAACGFVLLQVAWVLAIPPFAASDEFDHAYRAAAVARGEWVAPPTTATRGTGARVHVPADIVEAAAPECRRLPYTTSADCRGERSGDTVSVASGAGRYNPFFYFLVGSAALPFDGTAALYAMRSAGLLLCLALVVAALYAASAPTAWPRAGLAMALTPVALFSSSMAAPNGLEIVSAAAFWTALLALARPDAATAGRRRSLLGILAVSGVLLVTVRSLGPLWCVLACLAVIVAVRPQPRALARSLMRPDAAGVTAVVGSAALLSVWWVRTQGSLTIGVEKMEPTPTMEKITLSLQANIVWLFQSIAAFPTRDILAPLPVYVCGLALFFASLVLVRRMPSPYRTAAVLVLLATSLLPTAVTLRTFDDYGIAWQGRYTLPLALGVAAIGSAGLDVVHTRLPRAVVGVVIALYAGMHVVSVVGAALHEREGSPGVDNGAWVLLPVPVLGVIALGGSILVALNAIAPLATRSSVRPDPSTLAPHP